MYASRHKTLPVTTPSIRTRANRQRRKEAGMTLLELIIVCGILMVLASAAMPMARFTVKRQKEAELHRDLREIRDAIDRYKDAADRNLIRVESGTEGYPPDLDTLVKGVDIVAQPTAGTGGTLGPAGTATSGGFGSGFGAGATAGGGLSGGAAGSAFGGGLTPAQRPGTTPAAGAGTGSGGGDAIRHLRFLRRIPPDPMTGRAEWGMRSVQDDPASTSWGGKNVFDVFSQASGTALDGTRYSDW
jgi:type II secretory pathway pseudopilin PulG